MRLLFFIFSFYLFSCVSIAEENSFYGNHKDRLSLLINLAHEVTLKNEFDKLKGNYTTPF